MNVKIAGAVIIILVLAGLGGAYSFGLFNRPPKAAFTYRTPTGHRHRASRTLTSR